MGAAVGAGTAWGAAAVGVGMAVAEGAGAGAAAAGGGDAGAAGLASCATARQLPRSRWLTTVRYSQCMRPSKASVPSPNFRPRTGIVTPDALEVALLRMSGEEETTPFSLPRDRLR